MFLNNCWDTKVLLKYNILTDEFLWFLIWSDYHYVGVSITFTYWSGFTSVIFPYSVPVFIHIDLIQGEKGHEGLKGELVGSVTSKHVCYVAIYGTGLWDLGNSGLLRIEEFVGH